MALTDVDIIFCALKDATAL